MPDMPAVSPARRADQRRAVAAAPPHRPEEPAPGAAAGGRAAAAAALAEGPPSAGRGAELLPDGRRARRARPAARRSISARCASPGPGPLHGADERSRRSRGADLDSIAAQLERQNVIDSAARLHAPPCASLQGGGQAEGRRISVPGRASAWSRCWTTSCPAARCCTPSPSRRA